MEGRRLDSNYEREPFDERVKDNAIAALAILHAAIGRDPHTLRFHKEDTLEETWIKRR